MKFLLLLSLTLSSAFAQTVISQKEVTLPVDLNTARLKLSRGGYSSEVVKVLVPELADVTIADHRNEGEEAPCLATYEAWTVEEVIQGKPEKLEVPFTITLTKHVWVDTENKVCKVSLTENVIGKIRGFHFTHDRYLEMPDRHVDDCR